jgi:thiol-disulfide isomerase/thioredoxin
MDKKTIIIFLGIVIVLLGGIFLLTSRSSKGTGADLTAFAQCLKDKGAEFYGAFWCPHCQATKRMFGAAASKLPYTECSTPDGNSQNQVCNDKGIKQYPTWFFADGSQLVGELTLAQLSAKTSCQLPAGTPGSETAPSPTTSTSTTIVSTTTATL